VGVAVWAWTVDRPDELERMLAAGVDAVITNDPRILTAGTQPLATLRP
jgi:glycerophosphoryl diester phosphodiesterase